MGRGDKGARAYASRCRRYKEAEQLIPESQWESLSEEIKVAGGGNSRYVKWMLNQGSEGSCVGHAWTQQVQMVFAKQFGLDRAIRLSAISAYQLIGRSAQSGAMISDALDEGRETGIIPLDTPENRQQFGSIVMPPTGFRSRRPDGWEPVAKQFRIDEYFEIQSEEEMFSALLKQHPVVVGRAGHSIVYCDLIFDGNRPLVVYCNSWGNWGSAYANMPHGFGFDSGRLISSSCNWAYAVRSVVVPSFYAIAA
jgi:hypothetical protein